MSGWTSEAQKDGQSRSQGQESRPRGAAAHGAARRMRQGGEVLAGGR